MRIDVRRAANNAIQPINENIRAILKRSNGYTIDEVGNRTSATREIDVIIQSQPMTSDELKLIEAANLQGTFRSIHMFGNYEGLKRYNEKGADILRFQQYEDSECRDWKIVQVMESWPNWSRLLLCRQL